MSQFPAFQLVSTSVWRLVQPWWKEIADEIARCPCETWANSTQPTPWVRNTHYFLLLLVLSPFSSSKSWDFMGFWIFDRHISTSLPVKPEVFQHSAGGRFASPINPTFNMTMDITNYKNGNYVLVICHSLLLNMTQSKVCEFSQLEHFLIFHTYVYVFQRFTH